jgi:hypothetical protein
MNRLLAIPTLVILLFGAPWAYAQPPSGIQGEVTVVNTPLPVTLDTPVPVVVEMPTRTPVQVRGRDDDCGSVCGITVYEVPEGKRLLIEYVSADTRIQPAGQSGTEPSVGISTRFGGQSQFIQVGRMGNTGIGINSRDVLSTTVKIFAEAGTSVRCSLSVPNFENSNFFNCNITGYLEDAP